MKSKKLHQEGFTLIELMSVVAIIGVLSAIAVPQFSSYQNRSFVARAQSDLRHFAIAQEAYFVDHQVYKTCSDNGCVTALPGVLALSPGVTISFTAASNNFTGSSSHTSISEVCQWDHSLEGFLGCS